MTVRFAGGALSRARAAVAMGAAVLALAVPQLALADAQTWNPNNSSNDWFSAANWTSAVPTSATDVTINFTSGQAPFLSATAAASSVTFTDGGLELFGQTLNVTNNFAVTGGGVNTQSPGSGGTLNAGSLTLTGGEFAIHGTNRPNSVGRFASYGCFRMYNEDIVDLFDRVRVGTPVVVEP